MAGHFKGNNNSNRNRNTNRGPRPSSDMRNNIQKPEVVIEDDTVKLDGIVTKAQGAKFDVTIKMGDKSYNVNAHLSGKLKMNKIRVIQNDAVELKINIEELKNAVKDDTKGLKPRINGIIAHRKDIYRPIDPNPQG